MWPRRRVEVREVDHLIPRVIPQVLLQLTDAQASQSNKNEFQPSPVGAGPLAVWCYVLRLAWSTFPEPAISRDHPGQNSLAVITKRIKVRGGHVPSVLRDRLWALSRHPVIGGRPGCRTSALAMHRVTRPGAFCGHRWSWRYSTTIRTLIIPWRRFARTSPVGELRTRAKARFQGVAIGSPNPGHHAASAGVLFAARTGINANHAPFRGAAQTIPAMLALHNLASSVSQIKSGTVRPLAITGAA